MSRRLALMSMEEFLNKVREAKYSVTSLAKLCDVSVSTLARHSHAAFGKSPHVLLRELRLAAAKHCLADGMKVTCTAREVGYQSEATFAREFKKHCGYPPGEHARRTDGAESHKVTDWDI